MLELSEAVEALDAAIEYKNDIIAGKEAEIRRSQVLSQVRHVMNDKNMCRIYIEFRISQCIYLYRITLVRKLYNVTKVNN